MTTQVIISVEGIEGQRGSIVLSAKDTSEAKAIIDDARTVGISYSDKDFTYFYFPHRIKEIRVSRGEA